MKRIVSLWLPRWPIDRLCRARRKSGTRDQGARAQADAAAPLALVAPEHGGPRLAAVNRAAEAGGLGVGMRLSDARALVPVLAVEPARPQTDARALTRLAGWCGRYSPWTAGDGVDGIWLDITGCAHLFGGEAALIGDLLSRLGGFALTARAAVADTPGAAWAVARFASPQNRLVPPGETRAALAGLPVAALRLDHDVTASLTGLSLGRIGDLYELPRAPLVRRFGSRLARRLDQALGIEDEPLSPDRPVVPYRVRLAFAEAIGRRRDVDAATLRLLDELMPMLARDNRGARRLELTLYRVDSNVSRVKIGTSRPLRARGHLAHLFAEKLDQAGNGFGPGGGPGAGIEMMMLSALATDLLAPAQLALSAIGERASDDDGALGRLIDRLGTRLGSHNVGVFAARQSHIPERAAVIVPALSGDCSGGPWQPRAGPPRPLRLLATPEPVEAVAEVPEGPPLLFRWRHAVHRVAHARGPERIAPEWWRRDGGMARTRDYYRVEDSEGRRFWLYRHGLYRAPDGTAEMPDWYLHGFFP